MAVTAYPDNSAVSCELGNGMVLALERLPHLRTAAAGIWIKTGSANEQPRESGLAHFLEHLFFKGTKTRNVHQIMEAIESKGGHLNAFTSREYTCLYAKMLDEHIHVGIEILADILKNSLFCDLEKERNIILEEIASIEDTPDEYVFDLLAEHHWRNHPLGRAVSGRQDSVAGLGLQDVRRFYDTWYKPANMIVSVAGNIDEDAVAAQVREAFGGLPAGETPNGFGAPVFSGGARLVERDIAQAHICLAFPGPSLIDSTRYACDMASNILGGSSTSRLFEKIREEEGLAYSVYSFSSLHHLTGMTGISAVVAPKNFAKSLDLIFSELRRLCQDGVGEDELAMNREQIKGSMLMSLESTSARMSRMAKCIIYHNRVVPLDEVIQRVDALTTDDVVDFARGAFTAENCALTVLGPTGGHTVDEIPL